MVAGTASKIVADTKSRYMFYANAQLNGFWRGYQSALSLRPVHRRKRNLKYHGLNIATASVSEALSSDWEMVRYYFSSALIEAKDEYIESPVCAAR